MNRGTGVFTTQVRMFNAFGAYKVLSADLDGDNDADIVTANWSHGNVSVLHNSCE
jgi:hypothetical protein